MLVNNKIKKIEKNQQTEMKQTTKSNNQQTITNVKDNKLEELKKDILSFLMQIGVAILVLIISLLVAKIISMFL